jgi:hypothetical protein
VDESKCARGSPRESVPCNVMCPPFYSPRETHIRKLSPNRQVQEYSNKNILHGTIDVVDGQRSSLDRHADFLTSLSVDFFGRVRIS